MGFFSSGADKYSQELRLFPLEDFKRLFRNLHVKSLTQEEEDLVYRELDGNRSQDGKLSLRHVYNVIHNLKNKNKISKNDEKILMDTFVNYFNK